MSLICFLLLLSSLSTMAKRYQTAIFDDRIATLQIMLNGEQLTTPVMGMGSADFITVAFDALTYEAENFYYKIVHCNADWTASSLSPMEYLSGFDHNMIADYDYSTSTTVNYIHYSVSFPNDDVVPTVSGNYAVLIARDNDFDNNVVACACFSIVENLSNINIGISGSTLRELNGRYQQLEIEADTKPINAVSASQDFILIVRQNGRLDSEKTIVRPTYINGSVLQYKNSENLIFEAGNQYRSIDFSSRYTYGSGIDHIEFDNDMYHVVLEPAYERINDREPYPVDAHGGYVVNLQKSNWSDTEADYMWVHFYFPKETPFLEGRMYILGELTSNIADSGSEMNYDTERQCYSQSLLLKQGGYNYIFAIKKKDDKALTVLDTEGGFWQSVNRYEAYLYYRPFGARYDRLVGYKVTE